MAAPRSNSVSLVIEAGVSGEEAIRRLAADVRALAKDGGDAAPQFQALAAELDKLGAQSGAVSNIKALTEEVSRLAAEQLQAAEATERVGIALTGATERAAPLREQQAALRAAIAANNEEIAKANNELRSLRNEYDADAKQTATWQSAKSAATQALNNANLSLVQNRNALNELTPALRAANAEETRLSGQYEALQAKVTAANAAVAARTKALQDAQAAALAAGASTTDLAEAEQRLLDATQKIAIETKRLADEQRAAASVAAELADLDAQNAAAYERLQKALVQAAEAQEKERVEQERAAASARQAAQAAELLSAAKREQAEADRLALIQTAALAEQQERGRAAAQGELATIREAEQFTQQYAQAKQRAAAEALAFVEALDREAIAAEKAARREAELMAQAGKAQQAAQYEREFAAALDARDAAQDRAAASARNLQQFYAGLKAEADTLNAAFGQTGVRSLEAIRTEMFGVSTAVQTLKGEFAAGRISADDLSRAISSATVRLNTLKTEASTVPALPGAFKQLAGDINGLISQFAGLGAAIATVGIAVKPVLDTTIALDRMERVLTTVTGSAATAGRQIEFLRNVAQQSGQSFDEIGKSYTSFATSALQSGLSLKEVDSVFKSVALAAGNLGLSSDQAKRALEALGQIASKGTVSMEELRQQLGDALPGVLPLLAKELGVTQAQLIKLVESGGLLANEAIPAIGRALNALGPASNGPVEGIVASFNRIKNTVLEAASVFVDGPFGTVVGVTLKGIATTLGFVAIGVASVSEAFRVGGIAIYESIRLVADRDLPAFKKAVGDAAAESADRLTALSNRFAGVSTEVTVLTEKTQASAKAQAELAKTLEATVAAIAAGDTSRAQSLAQLNLAYAEAVDQSKRRAAAAQTEAEGLKAAAAEAKKYGELAVSNTESIGNLLKAEEKYSAALQEQLRQDRAVVGALEQGKAALIEYAKAHGIAQEAIKAGVEGYDKLIQAKTAEANKTREVAQAQEVAAAAARVAYESLSDNKSRVLELTASLAPLQQALTAATRRFIDGKGSIDAVNKATLELNKAKQLLRDAYNDLSAAINRNNALMKAEAEQTKASLELDIARLQNKIIEAKLRGDAYTANQLGLEILKLEQKIRKDGVAVSLLEAEATLKALDAKERELKASGDLTAEIQAEIDVKRKSTIADVLKAKTVEEKNKVLDKELELMQRGVSATDAHTQATGGNTAARQANSTTTEGNTSSTDRNTESQNRNKQALSETTGVLDRLIEQRKKWDEALIAQRNINGLGTPSGYGGIDGQVGTTPLTGVRQPGGKENEVGGLKPIDSFGNLIRNTPNGGITRTGSGRITPPDNSGKWELTEEGIRYANMFGGTTVPYNSTNWRRTDQAELDAAFAAQQARMGLVQDKYGFWRPGGGTDATQSAAQASDSGAGNYTVNVTIGGQAYGIAAASRSDLDRMIQALESAYRAGGGG